MFPIKLRRVYVLLLGLGAIGASFALAGADKDGQNDKAQKVARQRSAKNLQELMNAMWNYHEINEHLPPAAIYDKDGKSLLSWRVLLLPYLDQDDLFKQFRLDEPWDSKHNKPLLARMPRAYAPPMPGKAKEANSTFYQVFVGKGTIFEGTEGVSVSEITDGTSATIAVVEAAEAVPWTKPADLPFDTRKPLPRLGGLFPSGFHAALADGSVSLFKKDFDIPMMRRA